MTHPFSAADFFSLEAGECLDRLEALLNREEPPAGEDMLRAARALRGSALMAGQQPLARAAASLEAVTRAVREGTRDWDFAVREQVAEAIEEFRLLVRRIREGGEADPARAARLGAALESLAGGGSAEVGGRRGGRTELDAG
ncbi:MAG: Hpt domain-containing protein, partial [Gemmatimonadales bacterium]|nr:Hpt domain-containing protein [Gemmatimonadales bacterium]